MNPTSPHGDAATSHTDATSAPEPTGPLKGLRVLDLSRILAGPACTQWLGDLGCDVVKVERPGRGDDTRHWGPNYVHDTNGDPTLESAYYLSANRNKRSLAVDIAKPAGAALIRELVPHFDIVVENFKVGGLARYGLDYASLRPLHPGLIYCSITGFGQSGPYAHRAGYDYLAQGMGGFMSLTGAPDGEPIKAGVAVADIMCGMFACNAIVAALYHRERSGEGQYLDLSLLDSQVGMLFYEGLNYLSTGEIPVRRGNGHPNIVPYQVFEASDGYFILAVGNDDQFKRFCVFAGLVELADDPRFATNNARVKNRTELTHLIAAQTTKKTAAQWIAGLEEIDVPSAPVNTMDRVFADPQVLHREMRITMAQTSAGNVPVDLIGNPMKFSKTPVNYRQSPPGLGEHTDSVLGEFLDLDPQALQALKDDGVI
ncbi:CaiB/BaiF CoA transferase family protein [Varunaivibrio sulfuroxidans]|nr:CaiB/BaiF CoA-transferase family protein [Varunaivibrio sulfuroxidans]WES29749.1 CaiB/BaiF CoA-transferase family protein [Varunaivibrio sulfuroxidans]